MHFYPFNERRGVSVWRHLTFFILDEKLKTTNLSSQQAMMWLAGFAGCEALWAEISFIERTRIPLFTGINGKKNMKLSCVELILEKQKEAT